MVVVWLPSQLSEMPPTSAEQIWTKHLDFCHQGRERVLNSLGEPFHGFCRNTRELNRPSCTHIIALVAI